MSPTTAKSSLLATLLLLLPPLHVAAASECPANTTLTLGVVVGSGSLPPGRRAAQSAEICCGLCVDEPKCVAFTFEEQQSACFLKDNVVQCGEKHGATSGVLANRTAQPGGTCGKGKKATGSGYSWPPPSSSGSLWILLALLALVVGGGLALLVRSEKRRRDSSFSFAAVEVWHAACASESSFLPEIALLVYRLVALAWAVYILLDCYPNNAFCACAPPTVASMEPPSRLLALSNRSVTPCAAAAVYVCGAGWQTTRSGTLSC
jgi:hypothetical protein